MPGLRKLGASLLMRVGVCACAKGTPILKTRNKVRANFIVIFLSVSVKASASGDAKHHEATAEICGIRL
jgi:hypothetical protein